MGSLFVAGFLTLIALLHWRFGKVRDVLIPAVGAAFSLGVAMVKLGIF